MDRTSIITLISITHEKDELNQYIQTESKRDVFCTVHSISGAEWFDAGRNGVKAQAKVKISAKEYNGETIVKLNGKPLSVYRTYDAKNEKIELYLEEKAGVSNGQSQSSGFTEGNNETA